jgi:predicted nucleotidyltransferase component of viral defense system
MITKDQITDFAKRFKINESTIFREYLQHLFLEKLYSHPKSNRIFFKGGTAIHLIFGAPRFSEDLDFTVMLSEKDFLVCIKNVFNKLSLEGTLSFKQRKTITGKRYLMTAKADVLPYPTFINLDFSFREKVIEKEKSIVRSSYPIIFTSYIYHLSKKELLAEKIRALFTRKKGRDLYDIWYLITQETVIDFDLVKEKLKYYGIKEFNKKLLKEKISVLSQKEFVEDVKPFVPLVERERLAKFYQYTKDSILSEL